MSGSGRTARAQKKALLAARAELDRARIMLATHEIRTIVSPRSSADRVSTLRPAAAMVIGLLGPALGARRVAIGLRVVWLAITAFRISRRWR